MKLPRTQAGYSLIEVLVAVGILMLAIVAPMTIAIKSIQSSQYALEQTTATFLAQEALSVIEAFRNDAAIAGVKAYIANPTTVPSTWSWVNASELDKCKTADGCNFSVDNTEGLLTSGGIVACDPALNYENCRLHLDTRYADTNADVSKKVVAPFTLSSGPSFELTSFTRRVFISDLTDGEGVLVRVEVTWRSHFLATEQKIAFTTSLYNLYDNF